MVRAPCGVANLRRAGTPEARTVSEDRFCVSAKVCSKVIVGAHWTRARACRATPAAIGTSTMRRGTRSTTALTATFAFFP